MIQILKNPKYNFIGLRKITYIISIILFVMGIIALIIKGGLKYGIDFTGGSLVKLHFEQNINISDLRAKLAQLGFKEAIIQEEKGTNNFLIKTPPKEIENGKFREDLYYRLNVVPIYIPPLRERKIDIPILIRHLMSLFCKERGIPVREFEESAISLLSEYHYPGNIRELRNIVERVAIMSPNEKIRTEDIGLVLGAPKIDNIFSETLKLSDAQKKLMKKYIEAQLQAHNYNMKETAEALGIERPNLYRKMKELGIEK